MEVMKEKSAFIGKRMVGGGWWLGWWPGWLWLVREVGGTPC